MSEEHISSESSHREVREDLLQIAVNLELPRSADFTLKELQEILIWKSSVMDRLEEVRLTQEERIELLPPSYLEDDEDPKVHRILFCSEVLCYREFRMLRKEIL